MSESHIGISRVFSKERNKKISIALTGKKKSKESIAKRVAKMTGKKQTPESIEKRARANRGKKRTRETRQKQSIAIINLPLDIKQKMTDSKRVLSRQTVELIRGDCLRKKQTGNTDLLIAEKYGVSIDTVRNIRYNRTYKY